MFTQMFNRSVAVAALAGALAAAPALAAEKPITIGAIYIMSGSAATYGKFAEQGIQIALDEINGSGGVLGRTLQLKLEDGQGKAATAIQAARKLVYQDNADVLMGLDSSGVAQGLTPVVPELGKPFIITHAATPDATGKLCNAFTYRDSVNVHQNMKGAAEIAASTSATKWTTIGPDYAFGHQTWEFFSKYLKALKPDAQIMDNPAFPRFGAEDFTPFIDSVMAAKPDGVMISLWGGDLVNFVRQANNRGFFKQGYEVLVAVGAATEVLTALGDQMPEGVWLGTRYWYDAHDNDINKKFVAAYKKAYGAPPSYNAEGAYVAVHAFKAAMEKAGSVDGKAVAQALSGLTVDAPTGKLTFRKGDNQALIGPTWGKTGSMNADDGIRSLTQVHTFDGEKITPPVDPACKL
ncbi:ABC transporter substrate-binding protein [Allopusillimonas soli]|uniref:ABC transporter substrate-binding protein n=1 Tax=Allopusillimonas soli TaxID=659016 RepID=A0A853FGP1_9BURK|nr:ABC transporter substrate-binding protein [Allopusillimonas soli]NYT39047.1 ABC transporter substrate-binding protein [Allopusillimonas soli]TEA69519.1 ABC transporter substrate-binding protein [Allopusillimonas soli]